MSYPRPPYWRLNFSTDTARRESLLKLHEQYPDMLRWDGSANPYAADTRCVLAGAKFTGEPGRGTEAAEAWAFEMKVYFKRGVGEQPQVWYDDAEGVYTIVGLIQTSHPGDVPNHGEDGIVWFQ